MAMENGGARWTVISQQEKPGEISPGQFGRGWEIAFRTAQGHTGTVFVPQGQYTTESVRALIDEKVTRMESIAGLSG